MWFQSMYYAMKVEEIRFVFNLERKEANEIESIGKYFLCSNLVDLST